MTETVCNVKKTIIIVVGIIVGLLAMVMTYGSAIATIR
jgi:uncharacterized membrane-anchored protein YhcB (DUF1043 family)